MTASIAYAGTSLSGDAVDALVLRCAESMRRSGVDEGDAVAMLLRNEPRYLVVAKAARTIGAYAVPINWHYKADEVGYIVRDSDAKLLLAHADLLGAVADGLPEGPPVVSLDPPPALRALEGDAGPPGAASAVAWDRWLSAEPYAGPAAAPRSSMGYTSGTTGRPKGVRRGAMTPEHLARVAAVNAVAFGLRPGARVLVATPLYHSAPNVYALNALMTGELLAIEPRFDAERTLALIESLRISHLYLVPTLMHRLLRLPEATRAAHDLSSLDFVLHGAAPCPPDVKRSMIAWWGPVVHEFYGGSEAGPIAAIDSADWLRKPGSVGRPLPHARLLIADADGRAVERGATGTIYLEQGAYPPFTYHRRPDLRDACAHPEDDALFTLGDVGRLDDDGFLFISDRSKDMVISGGVNVYPAEIEATLASMPGVRDSAVFGVPDEEYGESLMAVVEAEAGAAIDAPAVQAFLRERLAGYKVPRRVEFAAELPREESGKIFKRKLREPHWRDAGRSV